MVTYVASTMTSFLKPSFHSFFILQETWFNSLNFLNLGHDNKEVLLD